MLPGSPPFGAVGDPAFFKHLTLVPLSPPRSSFAFFRGRPHGSDDERVGGLPRPSRAGCDGGFGDGCVCSQCTRPCFFSDFRRAPGLFAPGLQLRRSISCLGGVLRRFLSFLDGHGQKDSRVGGLHWRLRTTARDLAEYRVLTHLREMGRYGAAVKR